MSERSVAWRRFEWQAGADHYSFEIENGGMYGRLRCGAGQAVSLPMVAWEGLLECVRTNHKSRTRSAAVLPARAGARWSQVESGELKDDFNKGHSVEVLARRHVRTSAAIEAELARQGLIVSAYARQGEATAPWPQTAAPAQGSAPERRPTQGRAASP